MTLKQLLILHTYSHEYASGYYGVLPFFIAKVSLDLFTIRLLPNILFAVITYFMVGEFFEHVCVVGNTGYKISADHALDIFRPICQNGQPNTLLVGHFVQ